MFAYSLPFLEIMNILKVIYVPSAFLLKHHLPSQEAISRIPLEELLEQKHSPCFVPLKRDGSACVF